VTLFAPAQLLTFVAAGLLLNVAPGPDLLYIIARSLNQGRRAGVVSALGISAGCLVHTAAAALGISVLLRASPLAYDVLRYAGAAYLIWLGLRALATRATTQSMPAVDGAALKRVFWQGFATNVLNPKVALFFLAFLPQFADPARGSVALQIAILGSIFIFDGFWVCFGVAHGAAAAGGWIVRKSGAVTALNRASGAVMLGLGLNLALRRS
jgi:threonine/homoserine/homoserine lactone efflux protein